MYYHVSLFLQSCSPAVKRKRRIVFQNGRLVIFMRDNVLTKVAVLVASRLIDLFENYVMTRVSQVLVVTCDIRQ